MPRGKLEKQLKYKILTIKMYFLFSSETSASSVTVKQIPCSILNMSFFDKLKNPKNKIIHNSGIICKRSEIDIDGILVADNLRGVIAIFSYIQMQFCNNYKQINFRCCWMKSRLNIFYTTLTNEKNLFSKYFKFSYWVVNFASTKTSLSLI